MIRVRQIKLSVGNTKHTLKELVAKKLHIAESDIKSIKIAKESIDARNKSDIYYVYEVDCEVINENKILKSNNNDIIKYENKSYKVDASGTIKLTNRPIIVGSGPSGLFAALNLLENGIKPIIIERGKKIEDRVKDVDEFINSNKLDINSNIQFGEGGAGTFSDGKLNTLIKDKENRGRKVFETFVECGANDDILYSYKPHIGTDVLRIVIRNLRLKIESLGGTFLFSTKLTNIIINNKRIVGIEVNNDTIMNTELLILAIGNSARDTFKMLKDNNIPMMQKPFAVGLRIMHPQELIDVSQFGFKYASILSPATYKLATQVNNRGVYSFCMCPGGYVINSSSEDNHLVINGMSYHKRDSGVANSAIVVTVNNNDYGNDLLSGLEYQENLEHLAYKLGNGSIPIQTLKDFYNNELTITNINNLKIHGSYKFANLNDILPDYISSSIKEAINIFDKKIHNFKYDDAILAAIETRTSSPIRIERNEWCSSSIEGLYPIGEGAGYAGGITSSAIDGLKVSEYILKKYKG
jgi:hypothetical protein